MKGKGDKKGATSKSSSSKSPAKGMSDSFKSKEFVSSDESSSAESKKEVGVAAGGGPGPPPLGNIPVVSAGEAGSSWYLVSVVLGQPSGVVPRSPPSPCPCSGGTGEAGDTALPSLSPADLFVPRPQDSEDEGAASPPPSSEDSASGSD